MLLIVTSEKEAVVQAPSVILSDYFKYEVPEGEISKVDNIALLDVELHEPPNKLYAPHLAYMAMFLYPELEDVVMYVHIYSDGANDADRLGFDTKAKDICSNMFFNPMHGHIDKITGMDVGVNQVKIMFTSVAKQDYARTINTYNALYTTGK